MELFKINSFSIINMIWNLILALVPFLLGMALVKLRKYKKNNIIFSVLIFFMWLLFMPNTAYVISDVRHLLGFCPDNYYHICLQNAWMIFVLFGYASIGWVIFVFSLRQMNSLWPMEFGIKSKPFFSPVSIPVIAYGVMLGLVNRLNSWDLFWRPGHVFGEISDSVVDPVYWRNYLVILMMMYLFYYGGDYLFKNSKSQSA